MKWRAIKPKKRRGGGVGELREQRGVPINQKLL